MAKPNNWPGARLDKRLYDDTAQECTANYQRAMRSVVSAERARELGDIPTALNVLAYVFALPWATVRADFYVLLSETEST